MKFKKIPKVELSGATRLSPIEMNKIPFDTGHHSTVPPQSGRSEHKDTPLK